MVESKLCSALSAGQPIISFFLWFYTYTHIQTDTFTAAIAEGVKSVQLTQIESSVSSHENGEKHLA